jgi:hypothetical protein
MKNIGHIINGISNRIGGWGAMLYIIALFLCACDDHNHKANTTYEMPDGSEVPVDEEFLD